MMATTSSKQRSKSYVFAVEAYTVPSSVRTNICDSSLGTIHGRAVCYRSQKKTGLPYDVLLAFKADTELPQQWGRPRRQGIKPMSVQDVDWRSSREGGVEMAMPVQLYDARAEKQKDEQQLQSFHALGRGLENIGNFDFASVLLAARRQSVETKLGPAPAGSPMSYQQAQLPAGFTTWMSDNIVMGAGTEIQLSPEEARDLERNTRQQRHSQRWKKARLNRLTASRFGCVITRKEWTEKGLKNLIEPKDLTRVRAVQYG
ncbi:hypothetical protein HPB47_008336 [Ixodes persulcatus]|uniref:Uncharacterized protein n=1 Tax=Ixodes persulcatus TaxID=34615 RepID=A0AC60P4Y7_IXOPE|nr:hypothetical protein HPB47_008336 [Ixodes persulcatus]